MDEHVLMIAYSEYCSDARVIKAAETCAELGYPVDILALGERGRAKREGLNGVQIRRTIIRHYFGENPWAHVSSYLGFFAVSLIKTTWMYVKKRYAIVHVHNMPDFLVFCAVVPKLFGARVILDIHDSMPLLWRERSRSSLVNRLILCQQRLSGRFADSIITVHDVFKRDVLVKDGLPAQKITVIANYADEKIYAYMRDYSYEYPLRMIFHGTISERSGLQEFLEVLSSLPEKSALRLKIVGTGDFSEKLQDLIKELALGDIVAFENLMYPNDDIPALLRAHHLGLAIYRRNSATEYMLPVKLLEFILMGLPFIATPNKAITSFLGEDECFFCDVRDHEGLSSLLRGLVADPGRLMEKHARLGRIRFRFFWSQERQKYVMLIKNLLGRGPL